MPPKVKITKEDIIDIAVELVRREGAGALNARAVAAALDCSTQPIFSNFTTMEELRGTVIQAAYQRYLTFIEEEVRADKYPQYKAFGMAYIRFAKEEQELFRLLYMRDRRGEDLSPSSDFEQAVQMLMHANGLSRERAQLMHLEMWSCVHGIATMLATDFLPLDEASVSEILSDVYYGIRARYGVGEVTK